MTCAAGCSPRRDELSGAELKTDLGREIHIHGKGFAISMAVMERIMSKTNDVSRLAMLEDHNTLADSELAAVSAGMLYLKPTEGLADKGIGSLMSAVLERLGKTMLL